MCQLVNASLTHFSTSLPTGYPMGVSTTSEVISCMRHSSLLRCKCTNQVNLFSHPLYSRKSISCLTFPHKRGQSETTSLLFANTRFPYTCQAASIPSMGL